MGCFFGCPTLTGLSCSLLGVHEPWHVLCWSPACGSMDGLPFCPLCLWVWRASEEHAQSTSFPWKATIRSSFRGQLCCQSRLVEQMNETSPFWWLYTHFILLTLSSAQKMCSPSSCPRTLSCILCPPEACPSSHLPRSWIITTFPSSESFFLPTTLLALPVLTMSLPHAAPEVGFPALFPSFLVTAWS